MTSNAAPVSYTNGRSVFWGELPPCDHVAQFYTDDGVLLESLTSFVGGGLRAGESVILIATALHIKALHPLLTACGIDVDVAMEQGSYLPLDAEETLAGFMVEGWPDKELLVEIGEGLARRTVASGRPVRAFGEMVVLLWARGEDAAMVRLEYLWHQLCRRHEFALFCAYPRAEFTQSPRASLAGICMAPLKMIDC